MKGFSKKIKQIAKTLLNGELLKTECFRNIYGSLLGIFTGLGTQYLWRKVKIATR